MSLRSGERRICQPSRVGGRSFGRPLMPLVDFREVLFSLGEGRPGVHNAPTGLLLWVRSSPSTHLITGVSLCLVVVVRPRDYHVNLLKTSGTRHIGLVPVHCRSSVQPPTVSQLIRCGVPTHQPSGSTSTHFPPNFWFKSIVAEVSGPIEF